MHRHPERVQAIERHLYAAVADARRRHDRDGLTVAEGLETAAQEYAETVSFSDRRGHAVDGTTPQDRADGFSAVRENLAYHHVHGHRPKATARAVVDGWLGSEHRRNLLHSEPTLHGLGVRLSGDRLTVCHLFARREKVRFADSVRSAVSRVLGD